MARPVVRLQKIDADHPPGHVERLKELLVRDVTGARCPS